VQSCVLFGGFVAMVQQLLCTVSINGCAFGKHAWSVSGVAA